MVVDVLFCHLSTDLILIIFDGSCTLMLLLSAVLFPLSGLNATVPSVRCALLERVEEEEEEEKEGPLALPQ